jgi:hypothetical protein
LAQQAAEMTPVPGHQLEILRRMAVDIVAEPAVPPPGNTPTVIVDGLIGYSLNGAPYGITRDLIEWANAQDVPILSLDTPSGIDTATGTVFDAAIQATATLTLALPKEGLLEQRWDDLVGAMPVKLCFPALEGFDWKTVTGADPKNAPWSYQYGGNWPFLLWLMAAAAIRTGRSELAQRALDIAASRIAGQRWPEYYDGRDGRLIGREARAFQTWSIAGFIAAHEMLAKPEQVELSSYEENSAVLACSSRVAEEMSDLPQDRQTR